MLPPRIELVCIPQFEHEDAVCYGRVSKYKGVANLDA